MKRFSSTCCDANYQCAWSGSDRGMPPDDGTTFWNECDKCGKPCDIELKEGEPMELRPIFHRERVNRESVTKAMQPDVDYLNSEMFVRPKR